jgi:hypothetical protein
MHLQPDKFCEKQIEYQIKNSVKSFLFEVLVVLLQPEKWKDKQLNVTQICI